MNRPKIFICGPVTYGDKYENFQQGIDAEIELIRRGFAPLNSTLRLCYDDIYAQQVKRQEWLEVWIAWIECCDAVLRLPGVSADSDLMCEYARDSGKLVFFTIGILDKFFGGR